MNEEFLTLREIYEKKSVSQRKIAEALDISVGKANKIFSDLKDKKYFESDDTTPILTKKAIDLVESHKIGTAIILASEKMIVGKKNNFTPAGLTEIANVTIIERLINQLKERGINDIHVIAGNDIERYEYLIDLYDIDFRYDKDYGIKDSLSKLLKMKDVLLNNDAYIIDSNVYVEENIFHQYEIEPYINVRFMKDIGTGLRVSTTKTKELVTVEHGGENALALTKISFFDKATSKILINFMEKYNALTSANNFTYIDAIIYNLDIFPPIYIYRLKDNIYREINTSKDLLEIGNVNLDVSKFPLENVAKAMGIRASNIKEIKKIPGDDKVFTCKIIDRKYDDKTYIVSEEIDRMKQYRRFDEEEKLYDMLAPYPDFEKVVYKDKDFLYIKEMYLGERPCDINIENDRKIILRTLKKIHNMRLIDRDEDVRNLNTENIIDHFTKALEANELIDIYKDMRTSLLKAKKMIFYIRGFKRPRTIIKTYIYKNDFVYTEDGVKIRNAHTICLSDPLIDIAALAVLYNSDIKGIIKLYDEYNAIIDIDNIAMQNILAKDAKNITVAFSALLYLIKSSLALMRQREHPDFIDDTSFNYYRRFKECAKFLDYQKII